MKFQLGEFSTEITYNASQDWHKDIPRGSFCLIDRQVKKLQPQFVREDFRYFPLDASERNKDLRQAEKIITWLMNNKANRSNCLVAIGGGITTDIGAWVASSYMRGMRLILIPTTLTGMIDAAIGGKAALNFAQTKNLIGSFYPAEKVLIFGQTLSTLQDKEWLSGQAELVKTAFLEAGEMLANLEKMPKNWKQELPYFIESAMLTKLNFCQNDLRDNNSRMFLNLGHTFAHLIESVSDYSIDHGRAVAVGLGKAAALSFKMSLINKKRFKRIVSLLKQLFPSGYLQLSDDIMNRITRLGQEYFERDKKTGEKTRLILFNKENEFIIKEDIGWDTFSASISENEYNI